MPRVISEMSSSGSSSSKVHDLGTLRASGVEPVVDGVHRDHASGAQMLRAPDRELADGPAAEHADDPDVADTVKDDRLQLVTSLVAPSRQGHRSAAAKTCDRPAV
jgi:hypothetical protein